MLCQASFYGKRVVADATTPLELMYSELFLRGSAYRANFCAVTAGDALISVDLELAITLGNARSGATVCTCTTRDALITNLESHC